MKCETGITLSSEDPLGFSELTEAVEEACLFEGKPDWMFNRLGFQKRPDPVMMDMFMMYRVPGTRDLRDLSCTDVPTLLQSYESDEPSNPIDIVVIFNTDIKVTGAAAAAETHGTGPVVLLVKGPLPCHQLIDKLI